MLKKILQPHIKHFVIQICFPFAGTYHPFPFNKFIGRLSHVTRQPTLERKIYP